MIEFLQGLGTIISHIWNDIFGITVPGMDITFKQFTIAWFIIGALFIPIFVLMRGKDK